jgi:hypothetical protein
MQKIFLAFPGYQVTLNQKIKKIGDFEFWNLEKISDEEFISLIKNKIKPFNGNIKKNYFFTSTEKEFKESYKNSSWGMLLPNYAKDYLDGKHESLFTVNLYSYLNLPVMFFVQRMGISVENKDIPIFKKAQFHSEDKKFLNKKFIEFYKIIFPTLIGTRWDAYDVAKWDREDWRMYVACILFNELAKYQRSKLVMTWPSECADIVTFYESLLSKEPNDNGQYRISQKIEVLLGKYYKKEFHKIREDLKQLFYARNDFVHGSFFDRLKKTTKTYPDNKNMAQLPTVDFNFLETQSKIAKQVLVVFLYLKKKLNRKIISGDYKTMPEIINSGIMDIKKRKILQKNADKILKLMSFRAIK